MQKLEALSRSSVGNELLIGVVVEFLLVHNEVVHGVQREVGGFGFRTAVETDEVAVARVDVGVYVRCSFISLWQRQQRSEGESKSGINTIGPFPRCLSPVWSYFVELRVLQVRSEGS